MTSSYTSNTSNTVNTVNSVNSNNQNKCIDVIPTFSSLSASTYNEKPKERPKSINFYLPELSTKPNLPTLDMYFIYLIRFKSSPTNSPPAKKIKSRFDIAPDENNDDDKYDPFKEKDTFIPLQSTYFCNNKKIEILKLLQMM